MLHPGCKVLFLAAVVLSAAGLQAAPVSGPVVEFSSPNGLTEQCIRITGLPGAHFSKHDLREEKKYCKLDLYEQALCPKLWSTSPGTIIYTVENGIDVRQWEKEHCSDRHKSKANALHKPAVFKISVNDRDTSATYAPSSWVYYHFSRFLKTNVHVPVAVYRSMDLAAHNERVVKPALQMAGNRHGLRMLAAGWKFVDQLETAQSTGGAAHAALTDEAQQIFGVMLDSKGDRYGPEFNGTRESGWGSGQNQDFQQTAPFLALRSELPVAEAAAWSVSEARKNPLMAKALSADTPPVQVVFWMQDVLEITVLDYILGQQDRIGNIDYNWRWYWVEEGKLESKSAHDANVPDELKAFDPIRVRQSAINDNDAGVRRGYADFAQKTHMLEGLRHYHPGLYRRLGLLAADLGTAGPIHNWLTDSAGLSEKEADVISQRAVKAFELLQADCRSGALKLDLKPMEFLPTFTDAAEGGDCEVETP